MKKTERIPILYSKNQINEAGKLLIDKNISEEKKKDSLEVLNNRRAAHDYPINTFQAMLR